MQAARHTDQSADSGRILVREEWCGAEGVTAEEKREVWPFNNWGLKPRD